MDPNQFQTEYLKLWSNNATNNETSFLSNEVMFFQQSYVFKGFHPELENDIAFSNNGIKYLKALPKQVNEQTEKKPFSMVNIPGYSENSFLPHKSVLTREEMSECFDLFVKAKSESFSAAEMQLYNTYRDKIAEEQIKYLGVAKDMWINGNFKKHLEIKSEVEDFINLFWKRRLERFKHYPKFYNQICLLSLVHNNSDKVEMEPIQLLRKIGKPVNMYFPKLSIYIANIYSTIEGLSREDKNKYKEHIQNMTENFVATKYHPEVSSDSIANELAIENNADVVISASGFLRLIDNHYPNFQSSWDLPVTVKEYIGAKGENKKVVYIDKALPPREMNLFDRNKWFSKISCDYLFRHLCTKERSEKKNEEKMDISSLETFGVDSGASFQSGSVYENESSNESITCNHSLGSENIRNTQLNEKSHKKTSLKYQENQIEEIYLSSNSVFQDRNCLSSSYDENSMLVIDEGNDEIKFDTSHSEQLSTESTTNQVNQRLCDIGKKFKKKAEKSINKSYRLWKITKGEKTYLSKSCSKDFRVIIRCNESYIQKENKYRVTSKLEYQNEFGAEVLTLSEMSRCWANLFIRPETQLVIARINPTDGDLIMMESKTLSELTQDGLRLYKVNLHNCLGSFYSIIEKLVLLKPGKYHINHQPVNEAFVPCFKEAHENYTFNLHSGFNMNEKYVAPERSPWIPIDTNILTPTFRFFHRVPCTFAPRKLFDKSRQGKLKKPQPSLKKQPTSTKSVQDKKKKRKPKKKNRKKNIIGN